VQTDSPSAGSLPDLLRPLRARPGASAILCDIDGTLAPIAQRAQDAAVSDAARDALRALAGPYAIVGCVSGRPAEDARELVGLDELTYIGNHGFERLTPNARRAEHDPVLAGHEGAASSFVDNLNADELAAVGLRVEDKGPIRALHWRGAADEDAAEQVAREIATEAVGRNLVPHWGRKVLEIRPAVQLDKGTAIAELLAELRVANALYGGDDRTDIDAFRRLRDLRAAGELDSAVCVGIASDEGPRELAEEADVIVPGPQGFVEALRSLEPREG
jgi:trehalose 6-phosphate phosphatase